MSEGSSLCAVTGTVVPDGQKLKIIPRFGTELEKQKMGGHYVHGSSSGARGVEWIVGKRATAAESLHVSVVL